MICGKTNDHALSLQSETNVKIFRHVSIRPPFYLVVSGVYKANTLYSLPAKKGIVADERGNVASSDSVPNDGVRQVRKVSDWQVSVVDEL